MPRERMRRRQPNYATIKQGGEDLEKKEKEKEESTWW